MNKDKKDKKDVQALDSDMVIKELKRIDSQIESDRFTMFNIHNLIVAINEGRLDIKE